MSKDAADATASTDASSAGSVLKTINLALQGGGSHGAFTWGVLDRLLEEEGLVIEAISGTSAGAMNAAVMVSGLEAAVPVDSAGTPDAAERAGKAGGARKAGTSGQSETEDRRDRSGVDRYAGRHATARANLEAFWKKVSEVARFSPLQRSPLDILFGNWSLYNSPTYLWLDMSSRMFSPYDLNPVGDNPLAAILEEMVDFDAINHGAAKLFITATNVETGQARVFRNPDISLDVLLASACLPTIYKAVEIDGVPYWDGGYSGNPSLGPLVRESTADDTVLVQINPVKRPGTPKSSREIANRLNEVSFNSSLVKELRMMAIMKRDLPGHEHMCEARKWGDMRMHCIASDVMLELDDTSQLNAEWSFMTMLRDKGREAASQFLETNRQHIGHRATLDLDQFAPDEM